MTDPDTIVATLANGMLMLAIRYEPTPVAWWCSW
jgi:hypothetical protein